MPRALEDHDRDVGHLAAERLRDAADVLGRRYADVDLAGGGRTHAQLLHVRVGRVRQTACLGCAQDRDRARLAVGDEVRALQRVDGDVDGRDVLPFLAGLADPLADVEHRGLVALALTDDDPPCELDLVHRGAHGLRRRRVGLVLGATTHEPRRLDRGSLGDAHHLEREQLFHQWSCGSIANGLSGAVRRFARKADASRRVRAR